MVFTKFAMSQAAETAAYTLTPVNNNLKSKPLHKKWHPRWDSSTLKTNQSKYFVWNLKNGFTPRKCAHPYPTCQWEYTEPF
jgi:hypothetical protein